MKKGVVIILLVAILAITLSTTPLILGQTTDDQKVENAFLWLVNQADGKWTVLDSETNALALWALGYDERLATDGRNALLAKQNAKEQCWPSTSCKAKDTAFAVIALNAIGQPVDEAIEWLTTRETPFKVGGITWLLQIDSQESTNCTVTYDNKEYTLSIHEDKTYSWGDTTPSCLNLVDGNYWAKISSGCLDKDYSVSCETLSTVSLPYRLGTTLYIPSETLFSPADVRIKTVCIREGASCNYESTMWTAYALQQTGNDYTHLLPYLIGEAESNEKYIPDALLFLLSGKEEHAVSLLSKQNRQGFWTDVGGRGKYWDSALGIMGVFDYAPENVTRARDWLLKNQNSDGSFGTTRKIKDTAFVLSTVWPKLIAGGLNDCENVYGYFCRDSCFADESRVSISCAVGVCCQPTGAGECSDIEDCSRAECQGEFVTDIFGRRGQCELEETICTDNFDNDNDGLIDVDDPDCSVTCFELGGQECDFNQECDVPFRRTLESERCCTGSCTEASITCFGQGGNFCDTDQRCDGRILSASDASSARFCCDGACKSKTRLWIWILLGLIILGGAIFYLNQKGHLDRFKEKLSKYFKRPPKTGEKAAYRPPVRPYERQTPATPAGPFAYRPYAQPQTRQLKQRVQPRQPARKSSTAADSELQKVMHKLKGYVTGK